MDGTLGGGGHSAAILERLGPQGRLYGIDRDPQALQAAAARIQDRRFTPIRGNFHQAKALLAQHGVASLDGALLDLGVSSHQLDARERGFSYHDDAPLDMRMDPDQPFSARDLVNQWSQADIARVPAGLRGRKMAAQIARVLCDRRQSHPIQTTAQLVDIVDAAIPKKVRARDGSHPARRTFQALRIAVNDELAPLEQALRDLAELLVPGGRLCVIAFHSLEDRVVKNTFAAWRTPVPAQKFAGMRVRQNAHRPPDHPKAHHRHTPGAGGKPPGPQRHPAGAGEFGGRPCPSLRPATAACPCPPSFPTPPTARCAPPALRKWKTPGSRAW